MLLSVRTSIRPSVCLKHCISLVVETGVPRPRPAPSRPRPSFYWSDKLSNTKVQQTAKCMTGLEKYSRPILRDQDQDRQFQDQDRQKPVSSGLETRPRSRGLHHCVVLWRNDTLCKEVSEEVKSDVPPMNTVL